MRAAVKFCRKRSICAFPTHSPAHRCSPSLKWRTASHVTAKLGKQQLREQRAGADGDRGAGQGTLDGHT